MLYDDDRVYAWTFFSLSTLGRKTASWLDMRRERARSSFAPRASLLMSSVFSLVSLYRCWTMRLSSSRLKPAFHVLMSCDLGSPDVDDAADTCDGAIDGVRVGAALYVDILVDARLSVVWKRSKLDNSVVRG